MFSIQNEIDLCRDELAENYIFYQAIEDVNRGLTNPGKRLYELKALQDCSKRKEYLKLVRELPGYGELIFPHCLCDARKNGHVISILSFNQIKLQACTEDGMIEVGNFTIQLICKCISSRLCIIETNLTHLSRIK